MPFQACLNLKLSLSGSMVDLKPHTGCLLFRWINYERLHNYKRRSEGKKKVLKMKEKRVVFDHFDNNI